jgi:membrane protease YdiL (CAAX protease family)
MDDQTPTLKPLPFAQAIAYFVLPALAFILSVYVLLPFLHGLGMTEFVSYCLALLVPLVLMLAASLIALRAEGWPLTWRAVGTRFRLRPMERADWLWAVGSLLGMFILAGIFGYLSQAILAGGTIPLPAHLSPLLDPRIAPSQAVEVVRSALGPSYRGNWSLILLTIVLLFFNIVGEEFWWRGLILPRQELVHGRAAWLVHGTLWALFHAFKYWQWLTLLPVTLIISYVAQRRANTWPGIITHAIFNGLSLIPLIALVAGK